MEREGEKLRTEFIRGSQPRGFKKNYAHFSS